jgi:hypothetical protein
VLAAALTLWLMFALWMLCPILGVPRGVARTAGAIAVLELVLLLAESYGCDGGRCAATATVAGTAARLDLPVLGVAFVLALAAGLRPRRA